MAHNPYAPPKADVVGTASEEPVRLASRGQRFANLIIDTIAIYIVAFVIGIGLTFTNATFLNDDSLLSAYAFGVVLALIYYVPCEAAFGRTVGKLITGTRVIMADGDPPNALNVVGRTFARFIPFEAFSFFAGDSVGWHDSLSRTRVIRVPKGR